MRKGVRIDPKGVATTLLATAVVALIATVLAMWRDSAVQQEQLRQLERRVDSLEKHPSDSRDARYLARTSWVTWPRDPTGLPVLRAALVMTGDQ
jgi:hypothetical protein